VRVLEPIKECLNRAHAVVESGVVGEPDFELVISGFEVDAVVLRVVVVFPNVRVGVVEHVMCQREVEGIHLRLLGRRR
jgi:hypothetical protein